MNSFHMTMVLKSELRKCLCRKQIFIGAKIKPCSGRSVLSYTCNYVCLRCHRTSSPNYPLGLLTGLLYTNLRASTILQRAGQCCGLLYTHCNTVPGGRSSI